MERDFAAYLFTLFCPLFTSGASFSIAHEYSVRKVNSTVQVSNNTNPCPGLRVKTSTVVVKEDSTGLEQRYHKRIMALRAGTL